MNFLFVFCFLFFAGCSSYEAELPVDTIIVLQKVWNSKDPSLALQELQKLRKVEDGKDYEALSTDEKIKIFSLAIYVSKKDKKIAFIDAPLDNGKEVLSSFIKSKLQTDDWKTYEHEARGRDEIRLDVSEYSEKLGVGFVYDKLDKDKKVRMIYWGRDPKNIETIL